MPMNKIILQKAATTLLKDSADCLEIANSQQNLADKTRALSKEQRKNADLQHELAAKLDLNAGKLDTNAKKLGTVSRELEANAIETLGDTMVVQPGRPAIADSDVGDRIRTRDR
jgi:hypothetical protein